MSEAKKRKILSEVLGGSYRSSHEYLYHCPKCKHHKKKLSVNIDKNVFKCWICDWSGRSLRRIIRQYGSYSQQIEWSKLDSTVDISNFQEQLFSKDVVEKIQHVSLPKEFVSLANKNLPYSSLNPRNYLKERGVTQEDIVRWKMGYCPEGEYAKRIVVPSFGMDGHCNYFVARSYDNAWKKYLAPPISRDIAFNELFIDWDSDVSIVEGVFDAVVAGPNAVPLLGSTLREDSNLFAKIIENDTPVYMALDPDAEKKAMRLIKSLLQYGVEIYKVNIAPFSDVGEMSKHEYNQRKTEAELIDLDNYLLKTIISI